MKAAINCSDRSPFLRSYNRTVSDPCAGRPLSWSPAVANDGQCVPWSVRGRRRSAPDSHKRLLGGSLSSLGARDSFHLGLGCCRQTVFQLGTIPTGKPGHFSLGKPRRPMYPLTAVHNRVASALSE